MWFGIVSTLGLIIVLVMLVVIVGMNTDAQQRAVLTQVFKGKKRKNRV